jgi:hypothetical protein
MMAVDALGAKPHAAGERGGARPAGACAAARRGAARDATLVARGAQSGAQRQQAAPQPAAAHGHAQLDTTTRADCTQPPRRKARRGAFCRTEAAAHPFAQGAHPPSCLRALRWPKRALTGCSGGAMARGA